ncbi:MAG: hypothetical protein WD871_14825 [Xanthobacteraceae bacterium]
MTLGFACCAAHVVGVFAPVILLAGTEISGGPAAGIEHALTPGELPSVDPPPRRLL